MYCGMGAEVPLCLVCVCELIRCSLLCSVLLELCINFSLDVLYPDDNFTTDDHW